MPPMIVDAIFAFVHFLGIGCLIAVLAMETLLVRETPKAPVIERLNRIDLGYGLSAVVILLAGAGRVVWGLKGMAFYMESPVFWVKMGLFVATGLASVPPTLRFIAWRKALRANPLFQPTPEALHKVRALIKLQWVLLALIPLAAVLMARGVGG